MASDLFSQADLDRLSECIRQAELQSSGEIRVHLEKHCRGSALNRAKILFHQLGMDRTALQNGVLIYVATHDRKVSILGDEGIHQKVTDQFWNLELANLLEEFGRGAYLKGMEQVISEVGTKLKTHFPIGDRDHNELSNEISQG
ncbi:MAG: TPM domain-containing protein [Sphingomonadales bacterium]|nr:TPM domain-containing protein [Sphingomonadales bacterium]